MRIAPPHAGHRQRRGRKTRSRSGVLAWRLAIASLQSDSEPNHQVYPTATFAVVVFLNAARSSGVAAAGWRGRGFCTDQPIAFRASQPRWGKTAASPSSLAIQAATFGLVHSPPSGGGARRRSLSISSRSGLRTEGLVPFRRRRSPRACGPWAL